MLLMSIMGSSNHLIEELIRHTKLIMALKDAA